MKPLIWEISWSQNLAETGISVSLLIWILLWSVPMGQKEKIRSWYFIRKDKKEKKTGRNGYSLAATPCLSFWLFFFRIVPFI